MPFQLPDLPYAKDALAPHMSAETLEFHHGKHHKAYVTETNELLQKLQEEAVNHFASGWAWLVLDRDRLRITSLHDADTPLVHDGMVPLFTLDVWEHAYYIDYRNERPKFASAVLSNIVNWDFVA